MRRVGLSKDTCAVREAGACMHLNRIMEGSYLSLDVSHSDVGTRILGRVPA